MPRIEPLHRDEAPEKSQQMLDQVEQKMGRTPNVFGTMAHSPAVLGAYLQLAKAGEDSSLSASLREKIALATAGKNGCEYCASAHSAVAGQMGVDEAEREANLRGEAADPAEQAALRFARQIVENLGWVDDAQLQAVRDAGYSDRQVLEILLATVQNIFTNYFNHLTEPQIDFPQVALPERV